MAKPDRYIHFNQSGLWDRAGVIWMAVALCVAIAMVVAVFIWVF